MNQESSTYEPRISYFIAVCKHGYGVDKIPAMAIALAQTEVPKAARPSSLMIYQCLKPITPAGFKEGGPVWSNGIRPRLVGLTSTHRLFKEVPK